MKVLLAATPMSREHFDYKAITLSEPLALEYLAASLQENHDVKLVDLRIDQEPRLNEILASFQPDIIGCGAYTTEVNPAREICAEAKKILPGILTVVGGHHASVQPADFFDENIDVIVTGEGVHPFKKICDHHEKQKSFEDIENIYYRDRKNKTNNKMVFTRKEGHPPLDSLPIPDRTYTSHLRHHYKSRLLYKPMLTALIRASTGCIYRCKFCAVTGMLEGKIYRHSADRLIREIASIKEPLLLWVDDEFLLEPEKAVLLAKEIEKAGIKKSYFFETRSDTIVRNPHCIEEWAKIGLKCAFIGMESFRDKDLKSMRKGTTLSKNEEVVRILHANDVIVRGGFMVQPDFEKEDFKRLAEYVNKIGVDIPTFTILTPLPGTQIWEEMKGDLITDKYNFYDIIHTVLPTKLPLKQFYKEYSDLFLRKGLPMRTRKKFFKAMKPAERFKFFLSAVKMYRKFKKAYQLYD